MIVEVTAGTADYAAGGYLFNVASLQGITGGAATLIESVGIINHWHTAAGGGTVAFLAVWDPVNSKVQSYGMAAAAGVSTAFTEVANATANMNGLRCSLFVRYR